MIKKVIAIFDIGKTNKKMLVFDEHLELVYQQEENFPTIIDEDGFDCDDVDRIVIWTKKSIETLIEEGRYDLRSINFTTYGATLAYITETGERVTPLYNYLKPIPQGIAEPIYEQYGGREEFCRCTASPALGMLNSGMQILWLKKIKPGVYAKVKHIMHFPQYLSYCFTGKVTSEYTSIGCHTAIWNFDTMTYHTWLSSQEIQLPAPLSNDTLYDTTIKEKRVPTGIGIHDSSASIVPYLLNSKEPFILISTGTWCIFMNPFNEEPLTNEQLGKDTLCYIDTLQQQVKSSRLFMGHIHNVNAQRIADYFRDKCDYYKNIKADDGLIIKLLKQNQGKPVFFSKGIPADFIDETVDLSTFSNAEEAYHQLMLDLTYKAIESLQLVIPKNDQTTIVYVSGGFARNELFVRLLSSIMPNKIVYTSEIDNSTALGAALSVYAASFKGRKPSLNLGLKKVKAFCNETKLLLESLYPMIDLSETIQHKAHNKEIVI
jgi:sugar (pentulose or hexulose) kinase